MSERCPACKRPARPGIRCDSGICPYEKEARVIAGHTRMVLCRPLTRRRI